MVAARNDSPPTAEGLLLERFLPYRLNMLGTTVSQSFARLCARRFNIALPEWRVVALLGQRGRLTSKAIGTRCAMHKTMVSRAVGELERRRLVEREANPADKREVFVALSAAGEAIYAEIIPLASAYSERLTAGLSDEDRAVLDRLIRQLHDRARQISRPDQPA